ncbi:MAG: N-acetylmuramoyl-L-alanine amidase family protein [Polyangiaceae bacterium]
MSCAASSSKNADAGSPETERAKALLAAPELPPRADVLAVAEGVEASADKEGSGARAVELHALAGALFERAWRVEGKEQDAKEAAETFGKAAREPRYAGACEAAMRAAQIAGEVAHDAAVTYRELYRVERRFSLRAASDAGISDASADAADSCRGSIDAKLARIAPFRPPSRVLDAIDRELAQNGSLGMDLSFDAGALPSGTPHITGLVPIGGKDTARIVVTLDRPAQMRVGDEPATADHGLRTFVDLDGVDVGNAPRETLVGGIATRVLIEPTSTGARITTELDGRGFRRTFHLLEPFRVVIDVARRPPGTAENGRAARIVALDPGHGGSDPGAIGPTGVREKDVTLAIAELAAKALAEQGVTAVLTRDSDRYVSLEERTARANAAGADLFISIHCNAAETHSKRGVETYVLDTTKDETAARVAARENATSQAATREIGSILASMKIADEATHSQRFADLLERSAVTSLKLRYSDTVEGGVKNAGFYVLVGARMPAVLFETSYISNPLEEQLLSTDEYKARLSDGIVNAVKAYREGR